MAILFSSKIGPVKIDVVISEDHHNELGITANPIETGAEVNDHAYVKQKQVKLAIGSYNAVATYNALVQFQESRVPFVLVTGLSVFKNMLIRSMDMTRDKDFSTVLNGTVDLYEIIIVDTAYASGNADSDEVAKQTGKPGGEKSTRAARPIKERAGGIDPNDKQINQSRQTGTLNRGDVVTKPIVPVNKSILSRLAR